jgi:hypothetical protein
MFVGEVGQCVAFPMSQETQRRVPAIRFVRRPTFPGCSRSHSTCGGTGAVAPRSAGLIARINQALPI